MPAAVSRVSQARRAVLAAALGSALCGVRLPAAAQAQGGGDGAPAGNTVRFGILPLGGAFESRNDWEPVLADLSRAIGRPVSVLSVTSYEALERAIQRNEVDMAFLSGRMALDTVSQRRMKVVAQVTRHDGLPGYRALLLTRKTGAFTALQDLLAEPDRLSPRARRHRSGSASRSCSAVKAPGLRVSSSAR